MQNQADKGNHFCMLFFFTKRAPFLLGEWQGDDLYVTRSGICPCPPTSCEALTEYLKYKFPNKTKVSPKVQTLYTSYRG